MLKERTTITVDSAILAECRIKGLNVSNMCEDHLKAILLTFDNQILPESCNHKWTFPFCTSHGLVKECIKCNETRHIVLESYEETMSM